MQKEEPLKLQGKVYGIALQFLRKSTMHALVVAMHKDLKEAATMNKE